MQQDFEIVVISLKDQKKRREKIKAEMQKSELVWQFITAIAGRDISYTNPHYDQKKRIKMLGYDMRINEIACFLSHRKAWQLCADGNKSFLILEDDVKISDEYITELNIVKIICQINNILSRGNIIRLGNSQLSQQHSNLTAIGGSHTLTRFKTNPSSAFAYLICPESAAALLLHSSTFFTPVDDFMWRGWEHGCHILDVQPAIITTSDLDNTSTIGERTKPKITLYNKFRREINQAFERRIRKCYEKTILQSLKKQFLPQE